MGCGSMITTDRLSEIERQAQRVLSGNEKYQDEDAARAVLYLAEHIRAVMLQTACETADEIRADIEDFIAEQGPKVTPI